jgi:hypothetical protein
MSAQIIDGRATAQQVRAQVAKRARPLARGGGGPLVRLLAAGMITRSSFGTRVFTATQGSSEMTGLKNRPAYRA